MKKYIHIEKKDREFLEKAFGITGRAVFNALHFEDERDGSELMRKVRRVALQRGGIVMVEAPEAETLFDGDGAMRQYLPGGVLLEFIYDDASCTVFVHGEAVKRYDSVMVSDIPYIQKFAERFYSVKQPQRQLA